MNAATPSSRVPRASRVRTAVGTARRLLGAYYTPHSIAEYMADWAVRHDGECVLEPSFGDGMFLRAVSESVLRRGLSNVKVRGVEIDPAACKSASKRLITESELHLGDFLAVTPFTVQAVVGNPPYVRLRHLSPGARERALWGAHASLNSAMDPSGSLWMPFVLHAMQFLDNGGRLAFVLPYDFTYVRYARPLWDALAARFGSLRVLRIHERAFPDLLQDVVILLADQHGSRTDRVEYQAFDRVADLLADQPSIDVQLPVRDITGGRAFVSALLRPELRDLLRHQVAEWTVPARDLVTFNIGYVAGDKAFFHPDSDRIREYALPSRSLRPALTSTRGIRRVGLWSSAVDGAVATHLFLPNAKRLTAGEHRYIAFGEANGTSRRYKCRVRAPWFVVPGTHVPDIALSVFTESPLLIVNDGEFLASNSLLCGYCTGITPEELAVAWYTSLTLLMCELEVHALGGGVMVMIPGEVGNIRLPKKIRAEAAHLATLDRMLRTGRPRDAYAAGDAPILRTQLGLGDGEVALVREGVETLSRWRTSARGDGARTHDPT